ncbi:MAG: magnesium transporter CorA family protein, partial [Micrococcales bacterium]|nr:magnesium transporter CorA family protein [Micrococcales bacterium]
MPPDTSSAGDVIGATQITGRIWRDGRAIELPADAGQHLAELVASEDLVWLDLCAPDAQWLGKVGRELRLDAHSVEDALAEHERPKATRFETYTFSTVYPVHLEPAGDGQVPVTSRLSAYALPKTLLTVRVDDSFDMAAVLDRWAEDAELVAFGVDGLLQGLLDVIIDQHFTVLQRLDDEVEHLIDLTFADKPDLRDLQRKTFRVRAELVGLRRVVSPMRDVISTLIRAGQATRHWPMGLLSYYEDINDHVIRASEWEESLRDLVSGIFETNLSLNDTRMNEVMKKLAAWAAIIAVPTLITGWFG